MLVPSVYHCHALIYKQNKGEPLSNIPKNHIKINKGDKKINPNNEKTKSKIRIIHL